MARACWWQLFLIFLVEGNDSDVGVDGIAVAVGFCRWSSDVESERERGKNSPCSGGRAPVDLRWRGVAAVAAWF